MRTCYTKNSFPLKKSREIPQMRLPELKMKLLLSNLTFLTQISLLQLSSAHLLQRPSWFHHMLHGMSFADCFRSVRQHCMLKVFLRIYAKSMEKTCPHYQFLSFSFQITRAILNLARPSRSMFLFLKVLAWSRKYTREH